MAARLSALDDPPPACLRRPETARSPSPSLATHARSALQPLRTGLPGRTKSGIQSCWLPLLDDFRNWMLSEDCRELAFAA